MAREYAVVEVDDNFPYIERVYNETGLSWREAKKRLRQIYLTRAQQVRELRERDVVRDELVEDPIRVAIP